MAAPITGPIAGPRTVPAKKTPIAKPLCSYTVSDTVPAFCNATATHRIKNVANEGLPSH